MNAQRQTQEGFRCSWPCGPLKREVVAKVRDYVRNAGESRGEALSSPETEPAKL